MAAPVLHIENLHLEFPVFQGSVHAVNGVDLRVDEGEIVGLVGESGSAKSVTAMTALRLLPQDGFKMTSGRINLMGHDVASLSESQMNKLRGREVAMIFQEPQTALNPTKKIGAQMLTVIELHMGLRGRQARHHALSLLRDMRINDGAEILERYPFELSGGMRQRILIGMAFACSPRLLVADEPTTALDVTVQRQILQLMHAKARDTGAAILFISHDLALISQFCDRTYVMYAGGVVETGPTDQVLKNPQHPYTQALIKALPESGKRGEHLHAIPGAVPNLAQAPAGCSFRDRCPHAFEPCGTKPELAITAQGGHASACWFVTEKTP